MNMPAQDGEYECSDVCDAVVYPLKEMKADVFKDGSDHDLDHEKVVNLLNDEFKLVKRKFELTREELLKLIAKTLTRMVVLCNHLKGGVEPEENYVTEKMNSYPVLDSNNQAVLDKIVEILEKRYGVEIQKHSYGW